MDIHNKIADQLLKTKTIGDSLIKMLPEPSDDPYDIVVAQLSVEFLDLLADRMLWLKSVATLNETDALLKWMCRADWRHHLSELEHDIDAD